MLLLKQSNGTQPSYNHGEDKFLIMFAGLHIKIATFKILGHCLGSRWTKDICDADVGSNWLGDSLIKGIHVTWKRHAHEVTAAALYILRNQADKKYTESVSNE